MTDFRDFKNSYEQRKWENAVSEYARMKRWLVEFSTPRMISYANGRIAELEKQYPMLAVVSSDTDGILK